MQYRNRIFLFATNNMAAVCEPLEYSAEKTFNASLNEQNAGKLSNYYLVDDIY